MNAERNERIEAAAAVATKTVTTEADDRVVQALHELRAALDAGEKVDREMLLSDYSDVAEPLAKCLDAMELVNGIDPRMAAVVASRLLDKRRSSDESHLPSRLGDYRLIRQIGGGGMGIVFEAEQVSLGRRVALKVLPFAAMLDKKCRQRFKNEARAAATLDHPNVVAVHAVGEESGVHYYAMQLIHGQGMDQVIADLRHLGEADDEDEGSATASPLNTWSSTEKSSQAESTRVAADHDAKEPPTADQPVGCRGSSERTQMNGSITASSVAARMGINSERDLHSHRFFRLVTRWGIEAAKALEHAHENGVLHRDIKPGNLLIDTNGKLWVTDFGLARLEHGVGLTMTGDLIGTARYMSPEQAHGGDAIVDHRTDIYSLGVTLYEMLALQPAFGACDRQHLLRQIATVSPRPLRRVKKSVPADLETIVLKATCKEARERYASAKAMADDLQRFLDNEPIQARPPSRRVKVVKWLARHMTVVMTALVTVILALAVGTFLIGRALESEREQRTIAERQTKFAEENFRLALAAVDNLYINLATDWLANETAPSRLQQQFLTEAMTVYERLANQPQSDGDSLYYAGVAYERIGDIRRYWDDGSAACSAYRQSVNIGERLLVTEPDHAERLRELSHRYRKFGVVLDSRSPADEPIKALQRARLYAHRVTQLLPEDGEPKLEFANSCLSLARALMHDQRFHEADDRLTETDETLTQLFSEYKSTLPYEKCRAARDLLRTQLLRHQGRLDDAEKYGRKAHGMWKYQVNFQFRDVRELLQLEAALLEELAHVSAAAGRCPEAVERYREVLDRKRSRFKAGIEPVMVELRGFLQQLNLDENHEPGPFCDYVETQLHFARVLQEVGRPYEAEHVLGPCERVSQLLSQGEPKPRTLRYLVAWANSWTEVGVLLGESRPSESEIAFRWAAAIWRHASQSFPQSEHFRSGVRGLQTDWSWFCSHYSQYLEANDALEFGSEDRRKLYDTAFHWHARGRMFSLAEQWKTAITSFEKSAQLRPDGQAFDWCEIAMANYHLGKTDEARQWFAKASTLMVQPQMRDTELDELLQKTAEVLGIEESAQ